MAYDVEPQKALRISEQNQEAVSEVTLQPHHRVHFHAGPKKVPGVTRYHILVI